MPDSSSPAGDAESSSGLILAIRKFFDPDHGERSLRAQLEDAIDEHEDENGEDTPEHSGTGDLSLVHLPVQAGSDRVLKAMNRSHSVESYLKLLDRFRAARPDLALSGDFIVGFPGETDAEFEETLKLVDAVGYAQAFSFKYSPRPGTPAASMEGQVAKEVMDERLQRLQAALNRDQWAFNRATEGRTCEVLVERKGKHPGQWLGKTPWLQSAWFEGDVQIGDLVQVELVEAGPNSLAGMLRETVAA